MKEVLLVLVGGVVAVLSSLATQWYSHKKDKEKTVWNRHMEKIMELEEKAGDLTEYLCGYRSFPWSEDTKDKLKNYLEQINSISGGFRRYSELNQSARDFINSSQIIMEIKMLEGRFKSLKEEKELTNNLNSNFKALIETCDKVLKK